MRILVNATSLTSRGSYTVLRDFLEQVKSKRSDMISKGMTLCVIVSLKEFQEFADDFIEVIVDPFSKRSLLHRFYYEFFKLPAVMEKNSINAYLSLQNTSLFTGRVPQFVLVHHPLHLSGLSYSEYEFKNIFKYAILMNFITRLTIQNYTGIIVQTNWVKEALIQKFRYKGKIAVIRPALKSISLCNTELTPDIKEKLHCNRVRMLYVTNNEKYKNNKRLIRAVKKLNMKNSENKVVLYLTLNGISDEDVVFLGKVPYDSMFQLYQNIEGLIFPSLTETLGLPLMEAMSLGIPVLAAELPYAREVCGDYARYFDPRDEASIEMVLSSFLKEGRFHADFSVQKGEGFNKLENTNKSNQSAGDDRNNQPSYFDYLNFVYDTMTCKDSNDGA